MGRAPSKRKTDALICLTMRRPPKCPGERPTDAAPPIPRGAPPRQSPVPAGPMRRHCAKTTRSSQDPPQSAAKSRRPPAIGHRGSRTDRPKRTTSARVPLRAWPGVFPLKQPTVQHFSEEKRGHRGRRGGTGGTETKSPASRSFSCEGDAVFGRADLHILKAAKPGRSVVNVGVGLQKLEEETRRLNASRLAPAPCSASAPRFPATHRV